MEIVVVLTDNGWRWQYGATNGGEPEATSRGFEALADCINSAYELQTRGRYACVRVVKPVAAEAPSEATGFEEIVK